MSRYTGPSWRVSRRLGVSLSGTGKELARRLTLLVTTVVIVAVSFQNMVHNYVKSKSYVLCTV